MPFRFSLKWLLAAMAYVAFVLAALFQQGVVLSNLLWLVNGTAMLVAVLVALYHRGRTQAVAVGFVLFLLASEATSKWAPERSPAHALKSLLRLGGTEIEGELASLTARAASLEGQYVYFANSSNPVEMNRAQQELASVTGQRDNLARRTAVGRSLEPVVGMACGLLGAALAVIVWRRAQRQQPATGNLTVE